MEKASTQNPSVKDTPKRTKARGSPLGKKRGSIGTGQYGVNSSTKKKSSSQMNSSTDRQKISSTKKRSSNRGSPNKPIRVEVDLDDIHYDVPHSNYASNAMNTGRAKHNDENMAFEFQDDAQDSYSIATPVVRGMNRDE